MEQPVFYASGERVIRRAQQSGSSYSMGYTACVATSEEYAQRIARLLTREEGRPAVHPDDAAVAQFGLEMMRKLKRKREDGASGWDHPTECSSASLAGMLVAHIAKGNPVDIANFAMMLWWRQHHLGYPADTPLQAASRDLQAAQLLRDGIAYALDSRTGAGLAWLSAWQNGNATATADLDAWRQRRQLVCDEHAAAKAADAMEPRNG